MEPQIKALVSLTVDCILSYYYSASSLKEERKDDSDLEPAAKRRKYWDVPTTLNEVTLLVN